MTILLQYNKKFFTASYVHSYKTNYAYRAAQTQFDTHIQTQVEHTEHFGHKHICASTCIDVGRKKCLTKLKCNTKGYSGDSVVLHATIYFYLVYVHTIMYIRTYICNPINKIFSHS